MPAAAAATPNGRSSRAIVLKLDPSILRRFSSSESTPAADDSTRTKEPSSPSSSSAEPAPPVSSVDNASDAASTSTPNGTDSARRKSSQASRGTKRGATQNGDSMPKPRRPGPKKRRIDEGAPDATKPSGSSRLGPKANQGAINAGLRALDRSGAPCRRWERKPFQLKSFTGVVWDVRTWRAPKPPKTESGTEELGADASASVNPSANPSVNGDTDSKLNPTGSAAPSEKSQSHLGDGDLTPLPSSMAGSPAPAISMAA